MTFMQQDVIQLREKNTRENSRYVLRSVFHDFYPFLKS